MLMHQFTLALHHTSAILQHKSLNHHPLEVLKVSSPQSIVQPIIQSIQESLLFLFICVDLGELGDILIHIHGPLFQILKPLLLPLDNSLGYMMCTKSSSDLRQVDAFRFLMDFHVSIQAVGGRTRKLVRG
jgi:hypothetical protein